MGTGKRMMITVASVIIMVAVGWTMWYVVMPGMYDMSMQMQNEPSERVGVDNDDIFDSGAQLGDEVADGAVKGLGDAVSDTVGGLTDAAGGITDAVVGIGDAVDDTLMISDDDTKNENEMWVPPSPGTSGETANTVPSPEKEIESETEKKTDPSDVYVRNGTGFKESLTHRYVMYPPCSTVLDGMGKETRTIFGFPTPIPYDQGPYDVDGFEIFDANKMAAKGFEPKPCKYEFSAKL